MRKIANSENKEGKVKQQNDKYTAQKTKTTESVCIKKRNLKIDDTSKVSKKKPKLTSSEKGFDGFRSVEKNIEKHKNKEAKNKKSICSKRQHSKQEDVSNFPNKKPKPRCTYCIYKEQNYFTVQPDIRCTCIRPTIVKSISY